MDMERKASQGRKAVSRRPASQEIPLAAPPLSDLPCWGNRVEFDEFFVELVPQGRRSINVRLRQAFASISFAPAEGTSSLAGERLRPYQRRPFEYIVAPPRFPLRGESESAPEVLVFVFQFEPVGRALSKITGVPSGEIKPQVVIGNPSTFTTTLAKKIRSHLTTDELSRHYVRSLSSILLIEMCREMAGTRQRRRRSPLSGNKFDMLLRYVDANLDTDLSVDQLAGLVGASPDQLARAFKRHVGETPHNYVVHRRLDAAREMLLSDSATLAQIAYATGFSSQSHMTTAFKKVLGVTPGAIREEHAHGS